MKGMSLEVISAVTIALIGVFLLIIFVSGSMRDFLKNVFCYFYKNVLSQSSSLCGDIGSRPEQVTIKPKNREDLARQIAAYSILCWERATKSFTSQDTNCYILSIEQGSPPYAINEGDVTRILINEGGCSRLENNIFYDADANANLADCGDEDNLQWNIKSITEELELKEQKMIIIKYNERMKRIELQG